MDIILNDYSFNGQFKSTEEFVLWIYAEWLKIFDYLLDNKISVYKKSDFYSKKITDEETLGDLLKKTGDPLVAKIRSFIINTAYSDPYWDSEGIQKTDLINTYKCPHDDDLPNCFSEAIERDKIIFSLKNGGFLESSYQYMKNEEKGEFINIIEFNSFLRWLLNSALMDVKYVFENYKFERDIKFAKVANRCYAQEAILQNDLTADDKMNVLLNISELIRGLSSGIKNRFWDSLSNGLFEYRISISSGREFRLFFIQNKAIIFLNGFIKKEQKTPKCEIEKARKIIHDLN